MNQRATPSPDLLAEYLYGMLCKENPSLEKRGLEKYSPALKAGLAHSHHSDIHGQNHFLSYSTGEIKNASDNHEPTITATIIGNPYWKDPALQHIALTSGSADALIHTYQQHAEEFVTKIHGVFALILMDHSKNTLYAAVDRMGTFPLYFTQNDSGVTVSSQAAMVNAGPKEELEINQQGIYNYIYFHMIPAPNSVYSGVKKMQASQCLKATNNEVTLHRFWQPIFREKSDKSMAQCATELKITLNTAVKRATPAEGKTGAFLSGGLDSSTIAGIFAEQGGKDVYSIGFSAEGYDEMAYARLSAKHFGLDLHEYYVTPDDVVDALPRIAASYDEPFGNSSALPAFFCAQMAARDGVHTLLAGDGGDEIFAGNERYGKQRIFESYFHLPNNLRRSVIEPALRHTPASLPVVGSAVAKIQSYISQANTPLPARLHTYNFLHQFDPQTLFEADLLAEIDIGQPARNQAEIYQIPEDACTLNRLLFLDWQFTLADNDLRKVSHMCALAGVNVRYPMLDDDLIEFSCTIPSEWKLKPSLMDSNSGLRHFYKQALTGWLPQETIAKRKQGFGLPFGVWMRTHKPLQELAYDSLTQLKRHHLFRPQFLDQSIKLHKQGHAAYYGELIWVLMVLELWLSSHSKTAAMECVA